jgi:hypothetical protein
MLFAKLLGIALIGCSFLLCWALVTNPADQVLAIFCWVVPVLVFLMGCVLFRWGVGATDSERQGKALDEARKSIAALQAAVAELQRRDEK